MHQNKAGQVQILQQIHDSETNHEIGVALPLGPLGGLFCWFDPYV